jgi:predicted restriction endonuclease
MRADVLALWGGKCAMCGLKMYAGSSYECEVAHVRPVSDGGGDGPRNGLPLCRTHHWAFDHHLWAIRPNFRIEVRKDFRGMRAMKGLHGRPLGAPIGKRTASALLSITNVQARWADFCLRR